MGETRGSVDKPLRFDAFWHLQAIGVLDPSANGLPEPPTKERKVSDACQRVPKESVGLLAIIDTGVSMHPYLTGRLTDPNLGQQTGNSVSEDSSRAAADNQFNIDLSALPSLPADKTSGAINLENQKTLEWLAEWLGIQNGVAKDWQSLVTKLVAENINKVAFNAGAPAASNQKFSAHGTSCAGLIVASREHFKPTEEVTKDSIKDLPYYRGVDPDSKVLSITTSFAPRPDLLTLAFLIAANRGADVILFPRGLPREVDFSDEDFVIKNSAQLTPVEIKAAQAAEAMKWLALKETIIAVSKKIPVVCAAGNESDGSPITPARFAADDNGIIAVAAMNYFGCRSSYSNYGDGITIAAPSDDAEIFNVDQARLDRTDRFFSDHPYQFYVNKKLVKSEVPFAKAAIRTIDVPGPFGFSDTVSNGAAGLLTEPESFFTEFGGTSAAAAIVAGVAALIQRAAKPKNGNNPLRGKLVRDLMTENARKEGDLLPHLPNTIPASDRVLKTDWVDEHELKISEAFGVGLVAADKVLDKILADGWKVPSN